MRSRRIRTEKARSVSPELQGDRIEVDDEHVRVVRCLHHRAWILDETTGCLLTLEILSP